MPTTPAQPEGDTFPPTPDSPPETGYSSSQARRRREYSDWDPRSAPATYFLLGINCAVYLWMVLHGVDSMTPTPDALVHYGAAVTINVLHGQWYRLLTAIFVHVGLIHLATNMWCLWNLGMLGEPLVGPYGMIAVYMITGISGNLLGMASNVISFNFSHNPQLLFIPGAGASGAVFGIAGILIILLSNRRLPFPWTELKQLRSRVVQFAAINLVIGVAANRLPTGIQIDNMAHIGGFVSGLALGLPLAPRMTAGRDRYLRRQRFTFATACFVLALFGYWIASLA
jgi:rhomboid protease GluP